MLLGLYHNIAVVWTSVYNYLHHQNINLFMKSKHNVKLNTVDSTFLQEALLWNSRRSSFSDIIWPNWEWVNKKIVQCTDVLLYNKLKIIKMVTNGIKCFNFIITFNKYIFILSIYHTYISGDFLQKYNIIK